MRAVLTRRPFQFVVCRTYGFGFVAGAVVTGGRTVLVVAGGLAGVPGVARGGVVPLAGGLAPVAGGVVDVVVAGAVAAALS